MNVALNNQTWLQASLPVRLDDLGVRKIVDVSLPAFCLRFTELTGKLRLFMKINTCMSKSKEVASPSKLGSSYP